MKKNKSLILVIALLLIVQVMSQFSYNRIQANSSKIVQELEIVNPKEQYFPGDNVILKGTWRLEDDSANKEYKAGDTFSISIPEGMTPNFKEINLSGYGKGKVVGNEVIFTFTENVEQEINRNGGFNLMFTVDKPNEEAIVSKPIEFVDDNNNSLLKDVLVINNEKYEVGEHTGSIFHKGTYGYNPEYPEGLAWFINVNSARTLEAGVYTFEDRTHENHIIDFDSIDIRVQNGEKSEVGESDPSIPIILHEDQRGFTVDLNIIEKSFYDGVKTTYFDIYYRTIYIGEMTDEPILLKNDATLTSQDNKRIPMDHNQDNEPTVGEYQLGGWGTGTRVKGHFKLMKIDEVTQKPLSGARFNLVGKYNQMTFELVT
ncbi:MAG TPA: Ig-like domain-containing protein, partial [Erysipelothrix sp.]